MNSTERSKLSDEFREALTNRGDQRIGQLIINAVRFNPQFAGTWNPERFENLLWNLYDEDLIRMIKEIYTTERK